MSDQSSFFSVVVAVRDHVIVVHTIASFILAFALLSITVVVGAPTDWSLNSAQVLRVVIVVGTIAELMYVINCATCHI